MKFTALKQNTQIHHYLYTYYCLYKNLLLEMFIHCLNIGRNAKKQWKCLLPSPWHLDCKTDNISTWKLLLLPWKDEESPATFALLHEQQTRLQTYCAAAMMPNAKEGYKQISLEFFKLSSIPSPSPQKNRRQK